MPSSACASTRVPYSKVRSAGARRGRLAGLVSARPRLRGHYGTEELQELEGASEFLEAIEEQDDVSLTEADRAYLKALEAWLGMYPEMRTTE